jgi:hypothetical protein
MLGGAAPPVGAGVLTVGGSSAGGVSAVGAGPLAQPNSVNASAKPMPTSTVSRPNEPKLFRMWLIVLEALGALLILVFIVWWTMFSGRKKGERRED